MEQFKKSESIFHKMDEDDREPEMLESREILSKMLGINLSEKPQQNLVETPVEQRVERENADSQNEEDDY